jgi:NAD(P)H-hydrate epimerase
MNASSPNITEENAPDVWQSLFPFPQADSHKYSRGTALIRGGELMTGASRLAARAAQRVGAGLVTLASPSSALPIYAKALESVIVRPCDTAPEWQALIDNERHPALLIGPGLGLGSAKKEEVLAALAAKRPTVVDADGLTNFADNPEILFQALHAECVLTPHEGEFARLFGEVEGDKAMRALAAARRAGCVVLLKGAETVIASLDKKVLINRNAPPWLATAGAGDVLAGMILGLVAQKMPVFRAAAASAWMHGRIASLHGPGLIAEDIVEGIPAVLKEILDLQHAKFKPDVKNNNGPGI